jgi:hypothetical protein
MKDDRMPRAFGSAASVVLLTVLLAGCYQPTAPVTEAEASEAFADLEQATALALEDGDLDDLCADYAATSAVCTTSLRDAAGEPDLDGIRVNWRESTRGTQIAVVEGTVASGEEFYSEVEFVRRGDRVIADDPIFWIDRFIVD